MLITIEVLIIRSNLWQTNIKLFPRGFDLLMAVKYQSA